MAIKHITRSKLAVTMLNRAGHSISYDELQRVDTAIANDIVKRSEEFGVVLPSNIQKGSFIRIAADNLDVNEETIDGKNTTHATSIVFFQRKLEGNFADQPTLPSRSKTRDRTLSERLPAILADDFAAIGKRPKPLFPTQVKSSWFHVNSSFAVEAAKLDLSLVLSLHIPVKLYDITIESLPMNNVQNVPGWTAFNACISNRSFEKTAIGYCPLENSNPT